MSDAGGGFIVDAKLTLDDEAASSLPDDTLITTGAYKPTQGTNTPSTGATQGAAVPANFPASAPAGPYAKDLSVFDGTDPNGTWKLFVIDDSPGGSGAVANNWALQITTETAPPPDTTSPKVLSTAPKPGATGVSPTANVRATFSERTCRPRPSTPIPSSSSRKVPPPGWRPPSSPTPISAQPGPPGPRSTRPTPQEGRHLQGSCDHRRQGPRGQRAGSEPDHGRQPA